jgi:acyl-CoA synthetase (AMP-forming)/AMP-acid ligase II
VERFGERVDAVVVTGDPTALSETTVRQFCAERLPDYKVPEIVVIRSEPLPRNANGKIQKALLRESLVVKK